MTAICNLIVAKQANCAAVHFFRSFEQYFTLCFSYVAVREKNDGLGLAYHKAAEHERVE